MYRRLRLEIGTETVAVVTGAAGGIGRALALELASRGARLALIDIDKAGLHTVASLMSRSSTHICDVADPGAVQNAANAVAAMHGAVHILVNNAGVSVAGPIECLPLADFHSAMGVNFWGVVHGCQAFLPHLRAAAGRGERGAIGTILSDFALCSVPTKAAYAATKHAARAFTEALAAELHGSGISVTAAFLGATATALVRHGRAVDVVKREREAAFLERGMDPATVARKVVRAIERGRPRVLIGHYSHLIDLATRISPDLFQAVVRRFWRRIHFL
jgi:short-subunit dehydrogenase